MEVFININMDIEMQELGRRRIDDVPNEQIENEGEPPEERAAMIERNELDNEERMTQRIEVRKFVILRDFVQI